MNAEQVEESAMPHTLIIAIPAEREALAMRLGPTGAHVVAPGESLTGLRFDQMLVTNSALHYLRSAYADGDQAVVDWYTDIPTRLTEPQALPSLEDA